MSRLHEIPEPMVVASLRASVGVIQTIVGQFADATHV